MNTSTAGTMLTRTVQPVVDTLAVVIQPAPVCSNAAIAADTGVTLLEGPPCDDGWAIGLEPTQCPSDTGCDAVEVFHVEADGWQHDGLVDIALHRDTDAARDDGGDGVSSSRPSL